LFKIRLLPEKTGRTHALGYAAEETGSTFRAATVGHVFHFAGKREKLNLDFRVGTSEKKTHHFCHLGNSTGNSR